MNTYPNVVREGDKINVVFSSSDVPLSEIHVRCVLDVDQFGELIGVEILNLKEQAGNRCLDAVERALREAVNDLRYSYNDDVDAFYLRMSEGRSVDQKTADTVLVINDAGQIVSMLIDARTGSELHA